MTDVRHSRLEWRVLGCSWRIVRIPLVTLLVILEPVVSLLFGGLALLGVLITLFYTFIKLPNFPTWTMLTVSVAFGLVVTLYRALIALLSR